MPAFIVAEAGVNHLGDRAKMLAFCDAAKACGADAVKFQAYYTKLLCQRRGIGPLDETADGRKLFPMLLRSELTDDDLDAISAHCKAIGFKWFASVFDPSQVERVLSRGACALKVGHKEAGDEYIGYACELGGVKYWGRGNDWWRIYVSNPPKPPPGVPLLGMVPVHCIEEYPATSPPRLKTIPQEQFRPSGFSSHYTDWRIPAAAAMRGAAYIEAHLKLTDQDPEAAWSLSVEDFGKMVKQIREYESWL